MHAFRAVHGNQSTARLPVLRQACAKRGIDLSVLRIAFTGELCKRLHATAAGPSPEPGRSLRLGSDLPHARERVLTRRELDELHRCRGRRGGCRAGRRSLEQVEGRQSGGRRRLRHRRGVHRRLWRTSTEHNPVGGPPRCAWGGRREVRGFASGVSSGRRRARGRASFRGRGSQLRGRQHDGPPRTAAARTSGTQSLRRMRRNGNSIPSRHPASASIAFCRTKPLRWQVAIATVAKCCRAQRRKHRGHRLLSGRYRRVPRGRPSSPGSRASPERSAPLRLALAVPDPCPRTAPKSHPRRFDADGARGVSLRLSR